MSYSFTSHPMYNKAPAIRALSEKPDPTPDHLRACIMELCRIVQPLFLKESWDEESGVYWFALKQILAVLNDDQDIVDKFASIRRIINSALAKPDEETVRRSMEAFRHGDYLTTEQLTAEIKERPKRRYLKEGEVKPPEHKKSINELRNIARAVYGEDQVPQNLSEDVILRDLCLPKELDDKLVDAATKAKVGMNEFIVSIITSVTTPKEYLEAGHKLQMEQFAEYLQKKEEEESQT